MAFKVPFLDLFKLEHSFYLIEVGGHENCHIQNPKSMFKDFFQIISLKYRQFSATITESFPNFKEIM